MPYTFTPYLNSKANRHGEHNVLIRIYNEGERRSAATDYYIEKKHWDPVPKPDSIGVLQYVKKTYYDYRNANTQLALRISRARTFINEIEQHQGRSATIDEIRAVCEGKSLSNVLDDFISWAHKALDAEYNEKQFAVKDTCTHALNALCDYMQTHKFSIYQLTADKIKGFQNYLLTRGAPSTANVYLTNLKMILGWARTDDHLNYNLDPFKRIKKAVVVHNGERKNKDEDLFLVEHTEFTDPVMVMAKDFLLVCYYLRGMRGGDLVLLKVGNLDFRTGRVKYTPRKTSRKKPFPISAKIPDQVKGILEKYCLDKKSQDYVFPLMKPGDEKLPPKKLENRVRTEENKINRGLKLIEKELGLKRKLRTHSARYALADVVNKKFGRSGVREVLNHSNEMTSEHYFNQDQERIDKMGDEVY